MLASPTVLQPLSATLLDAISATDASTHAALWDPLLLLLRDHPAALQQRGPQPSHVISRLVSLLRHGCYGAAVVVS